MSSYCIWRKGDDQNSVEPLSLDEVDDEIRELFHIQGDSTDYCNVYRDFVWSAIGAERQECSIEEFFQRCRDKGHFDDVHHRRLLAVNALYTTRIYR